MCKSKLYAILVRIRAWSIMFGSSKISTGQEHGIDSFALDNDDSDRQIGTPNQPKALTLYKKAYIKILSCQEMSM